MSHDTIPVGHIPGGVWKRAPLITPEGRPATAHHDGSQRALALHYEATPNLIGPDWRVDLSDPLGLGLAGLAGRVAQRLGGELMRPDDESWDLDAVVPPHVLGLLGGPTKWTVYVSALSAQQLVAVATHLALTDRLCAAVGMELAEGEVARWVFEDHDRTGLTQGQGWWCLETAAGRWKIIDGGYLAADWLPALQAALAGVSVDT